MHKGVQKQLDAGPLIGQSGQVDSQSGGTLTETAIFLFFCTLVAFLFGFYRIRFYSLWLDEYSTLMATGDWDTLYGYLRAFPEQQPLYYFVIKWLSVNHTLLQIRLFSLACGVLAIFPLYFIGRQIFSTGTARAGCIFFVLSPFIQYFNQEGRMYTLIVLLAMMQVAFLVKWTQDGRSSATYGFTILSILSMYTHFFTSFLLAGEFIWILVLHLKKGQTKIRLSAAIGVFALVGLAYAPWMFRILSNLGGMSQNWRSLYNIAFGIPYTFFRFGVGYGIFPLDYAVKLHLTQYVPSALFWGAIFCLAYLPAAVLVIKRLRQVNAVQGLVFVIAFLPIILVVAASFFKNVASERYVIFSAPFFYLIVASALEPGAAAGRVTKIASVGLPILLFMLGIGFHYFNPHFGKTNYKGASAYILEQDSGAARVLCTPDAVAGPMQYYLKSRMAVTPYRLWQPSPSDSDVWLVERLADVTAPMSLAGNRFVEISRKIFPQENGLRVTHWRQFRPEQEKVYSSIP